MKVLIVDDTQVNQNLLKVAFMSEGFQVLQAYDGIAGLEAAEKEKPDLVLLDIMMPKMDGIEVLKRMKFMDANLPVVMMTAHGSEQIAVESMKLGASDYLTRPFHHKDVVLLADKLIKERLIRLDNLRLREKVEKTERYVTHIVDSINEAIISTDSEGKIRSFNRAASACWGMDGKEIIGKGIINLFYRVRHPQFIEGIIGQTRDSGSFNGEFLFLKKDGNTFPGHLTTSILRDEGDQGGVVCVIRDLTVEKMLQQQLVESQKLAALGKVVEGVAHEVRNPLLSIGGFARRIHNNLDEASPHQRYLHAIIKDVERLEKMIGDIESYVTFSKLHQLTFTPLNLGDIVYKAIDEFRDRMDKLKIGSSVKFSEDMPTIYGDEIYIREMFNCLIENAIDAMPDGGNLDISFNVEGNYLIVDISDTGRGIPEAQIGEIFDPFFTSKMTGAGLGLTKCHMIVTEHQGYIRVASKMGKGTTFSIGFPVERRQQSA